jgi:site-specific DNA-methyltransferase (adenine-specific)
MGKAWDGGDIAFRPDVWRHVLRVLKPGGHLLAIGGTRTYHRMVCAIEDAGFEIRDTIMWVYGSGFPKSQNIAKFIDRELGVEGTLGGPRSDAHAAMLGAGVARRGEKHDGWDRPWMDDPEAIVAAQSVYVPGSPQAKEFDGFGTALKPAVEPVVLARKPLSEGTVAANVLKWGCGALNIGACRVGTTKDVPTSASKTPNNIYGAGMTSLTGGTDNSGFNPNIGRWPANVVHDGSDEVVGAFPESVARPVSPDKIGKSGCAQPRGMFGIGSTVQSGYHDSETSAARFFQQCQPDTRAGEASAQRRYTDEGSTNFAATPGQRREPVEASRLFYEAKADADDRLGSRHPTIKPVLLMQWLVRLVTRPGGVVLDCFAGTGTTGEACLREGMRAVLIEREAEYQNDIRRRMRLAMSGPDERSREAIKARMGDKPIDAGPLFSGRIQEAAE